MAQRRTGRNATISEIRIYFEGNGTLRPGFEKFFDSLRQTASAIKVEFHLIAARNGNDYKKAARSHPNSWNLLLLDAEQELTNRATLCRSRGIDQAYVNKVFWMVQLMESWFLADPSALERYYGDGFASKAVGQTANVETIPKAEVKERLNKATKNTTKREYDKVAHAPRLLELLDPGRVQARAPHCREFFDAISAKLQQRS